MGKKTPQNKNKNQKQNKPKNPNQTKKTPVNLKGLVFKVTKKKSELCTNSSGVSSFWA